MTTLNIKCKQVEDRQTKDSSKTFSMEQYKDVKLG